MKMSVADRLMRRVVVNDETDCWEWTGSQCARGYGSIRINYVLTSVHRLSYEMFVGPIPDGLTIDHLCRVPRCINPRHLEAVSMAENVRRAARIGHHANAPTTCKNGHDWSVIPPIVYTRSSDGGTQRRCRACQADAARRWRQRRTDRARAAS